MSGFDVEREDVELLRLSARSLVDETGEGCWGTAYDLSVLIERLVRASGQPAAYFGNGMHIKQEAAWLGDFLPECCPACGEWAGKHERWCVYWQESKPAAASEPEPEPSGVPPVHYEGCCPICHQQPLLYFAEDHSEYMVCEKHRLAWYVGRGNRSAWEYMTSEDRAIHQRVLSLCKVIDVPECTCSSEPSEQEPEPGADLEGLLTWLDLSGLPPVPLAEPPARKPTNWHFDAPDGGQVQGPEDYPF